MLQPTTTRQRPPLAPRAVGDIRRVQAARTLVAPPPPQPIQPAQSEGSLQRLIAWFKRLLGLEQSPPTPPTPIPTPNPTPAPAGMDVYFTNVYAGTKGGRTNAEVTRANEASAQADPLNPNKQLISLIDSVSAGGTLDGAFFDIEADDVVAALCRAAQRGVAVRMVTETDYYLTPDGTATRGPIAQLQAAGIEIHSDNRSGGLMHDKFLVANGTTVWTGSYNITQNGAYRENNNALRIDSPELATEFEREFDKMYVHGNFAADTDNGVSADDHPAPKTVRIGTVEVTTYFSPSRAAQSGAMGAIMAEVGKAQKSIQFLAFSFTDDQLGDLMLQKARQGVKVEGVFEKSQAASRYSEFQRLDPAEVPLGGLLDVRTDTNPANMHHKVIVIDDSTVIMGSFNFSANAQQDNDENLLVIKNAPDLVARYKEEFARVQTQAA